MSKFSSDAGAHINAQDHLQKNTSFLSRLPRTPLHVQLLLQRQAQVDFVPSKGRPSSMQPPSMDILLILQDLLKHPLQSPHLTPKIKMAKPPSIKPYGETPNPISSPYYSLMEPTPMPSTSINIPPSTGQPNMDMSKVLKSPAQLQSGSNPSQYKRRPCHRSCPPSWPR